MNRDDIARMAKVAERYAGDFCNGIGDSEQHHWFDAYNERFAALVAAAEREACAKVCDGLDAMSRDPLVARGSAEECAEAIRKRGEVKP